jgi:Flp pilus assembly protein TadG
MNDMPALPSPQRPPHSNGLHSQPQGRGRFKVEKTGRTCRRHRRGAAAVEFAVVAPIFVLLVFGMIEFGRMVMVQQMLTNAAREGARLGVIEGNTSTDVENRVDEYLAAASITGATVTVTTLPASGDDTGDRISVTVSIPFSQVSWLPTPMYLGGESLASTAIMRAEEIE